MQILKSGRHMKLPEPAEPEVRKVPHQTQIQCRRCLVIFDWLDQMPRGMRAGRRSLMCETKACRQPFRVRTKIVEGRNFLIPFLLEEPCPKFLATSSQAPKFSSSGRPLGSKKSS